ncbi:MULTISPECIES: hypothetical protein [Burkholderiaceae]|uniref:hypothetical protein n=1 Tax=Burkholderiaceae TaxID=119060 RepID=UPI0009659EE7|nr:MULTISPECIES: hypothetical protein [Burkholderiaceae]MCG1040094.1 hypothetical protein [Mycetohabitans sp. B7]SIT72764.1 hypothetical protein SAMN04487769_2123 [Burkholderia sp. b14]
MDFDLNAALNDYSAYIRALESCPQPAASVPPPRQPPSSALANTSASRPTTYHDLPPELIERIGDYVPVQDVKNFSVVNRRTYHAMQTKQLVYRYWQRANQAVSLASINQLLNEMDGTLADPAQHVEPIDALRQRLQALPKAEQGEAFKRLFAAAQRIPKHGLPIQKALMLRFRYLPWYQRLEVFDFAHALVAQRGPEQDNVWPALAIGLINFNIGSPEFIERYQAILARLPSLNVSQQAELISVLVGLLGHLHSDRAHPSKSAQYAFFYEQTLRLPPAYQGKAVGALADSIWVLPKTEQPVRYAQMRDLALSLPDEQWGIAFRHLPAAGIKALPPDQHAQELALFERHLARVPAAQREGAALGLLSSIRYLDEALSQRVWPQGLDLINGRGEAALLRLLTGLQTYSVFRTINDQKLLSAKAQVIEFMEANRFSEAARARILDSVRNWNFPWLRHEPS